MRSDRSSQILITGASGFLGAALAATLRGPNLRSSGGASALRFLVRDRRRAESGGLPADALLVADLRRPLAAELLANVEVVVHLAGVVKATRADEFRAGNVQTTAHLLDALPRECRVLAVSSLAAAGPSIDGEGSDAPPDRCRPVSHYGESKRQGELAVLRDADRTGRAWLILRPPAVYGAGDAATRLLFRQACGIVTPVPWRPRPLSFLHVRDLCAAIVLALDDPLANRRILPVDGASRTDTHSLMREIAAACGRRARLVPVPVTLAKLVALGAGVVDRIRGRASYFNFDKMREVAAAGWIADPVPAREVLGFRPGVPLRAGLREVAEADGFVSAQQEGE